MFVCILKYSHIYGHFQEISVSNRLKISIETEKFGCNLICIPVYTSIVLNTDKCQIDALIILSLYNIIYNSSLNKFFIL